MAFSKIILNGTTLMDVTDTTAAASDVNSGATFYNAAGVKTTGTNLGTARIIFTQDQNGYIVLDDDDYEIQTAVGVSF